jgi:hypothetical protein
LIAIVEESGVSIAEERYKYERGNTCRAEASVNIEILGWTLAGGWCPRSLENCSAETKSEKV